MSGELNQSEQFKLCVHLGLFGFGVACALYNLGAWCSTRHCQNRNNALVYGALILYEMNQVIQHATEL